MKRGRRPASPSALLGGANKTRTDACVDGLAPTLAPGRSPPRRVEQTANASVMLRDIDRRATSILSPDRNVDESAERTGVLIQRIAEGGGVGDREALMAWQRTVM